MAQSLLRYVSEESAIGGNSQRVADAALSSTTLASVFNNGTAAQTDHGSASFTKGMYKIRFKSVGGFSTANGQLALAVSADALFATRQLHPIPNPISPAATVAVPTSISYVGWFDNDPTLFRYTRIENAGVVIGGAAVTFDWEVLALP